MVKFSGISQSNAQLSSSTIPHVAVFVGGTSGIGKITLEAIARLDLPFRVYVIGRKESEQSFKLTIDELEQNHSKTKIVWIEGQVSLLSEVKRVCEHIKTLEDKIDLLFMTTGYAPFGGRENTTEGLDISHALGFYTRICFVENLLPLLRASDQARVISVLSGGMEARHKLNIDDLNLEEPGAFGPIVTQMHMGIMGTLTLERLAEMEDNHSIVFIHSHPGIVMTGNVFRGWKEGSWGLWMTTMILNPLLRLFTYSNDESAQRHLYQATSGTFGGKGPTLEGVEGRTSRGKPSTGLFLVNYKCDSVMNEKEMTKLRDEAQEAVWLKVRGIIDPFI